MYYKQNKKATNKSFVVKYAILHTVECLKLVSVRALRVIPIHDAATREKRVPGTDHVFVHFHLKRGYIELGVV